MKQNKKLFVGRIYLIKNKVNDKPYIGETLTSIDKRFKQHLNQAFYERSTCYNCRLHKAIREFGKDVFYIEELECITSIDRKELKQMLKKLEKEYIKKYDSFENGYNSNSGSIGGSVLAEEIKKHLSEVKKSDIKNTQRLIENSKKRLKKINVYDYYSGEYLFSSNSIKELAEEYKIDASSITKVCKGKHNYITLNDKRCKVLYDGETYNRTFQFIVKTEDGSYIDYCVDSYDIKIRYGVDYSAVCRVCDGKKQSAGKLNGKKLIWSYYETNSN